jgi:hypothetical protein
MSGGHHGAFASNCDACWEIAYEPGWYAVLNASEGVIHLPGETDDTVVVRLPETREVRPSSGQTTHTPVVGWRGKR